MNSDVEDLIGEVLLAFEEECGALLQLNLESCHGVHISDCRLRDLFPKELGVVEQECNMCLLKATDLHLLVELLGLRKTLHDVSLTIFPRQLRVLRELDRKRGL